MRIHIVKAIVNGLPHHYSCPYCGMFDMNPKIYPEHMNKMHPALPGCEWKLVASLVDGKFGDGYWVVQDEFVVKPKKKEAKKNE